MLSTLILCKLNYERLNVHYVYWLKTHRFESDMRNRFTASGNAQILISMLLRHSASTEFHCSTGYHDERAPNWKRNDRKLRPELRGYIVSFRATVLKNSTVCIFVYTDTLSVCCQCHPNICSRQWNQKRSSRKV